MSKIEELKQEADELGVKYSPNIGEAKLQEKIDAYYEAQETVGDSIAEAISQKEADELAEIEAGANKKAKAVAKRKTMLQRSKEAEAKARETKVIEIIDNDPRVNGYTQTVTVTCSNEYFDLGTIILPLGVKVEVMQGHINVLKEVMYPHHIQGKGGTTSQVQMRRRYSLSDANL